MNILFIHQNFPGQFRHIAADLANAGEHRVVAIGDSENLAPRGAFHPRVTLMGYRLPPRPGTASLLAAELEPALLRAERVAGAALELRKGGFVPDVIVGHPGWGETLFLKDVIPTARLISFCEFYYRTEGADVNFDPEYLSSPHQALRLRTRNMRHLMAIEAADMGIAPTQWQRSTFPAPYQSKIAVVHEGIDTLVARPNPSAIVTANGRSFRVGDEVVTYVARNLEPYRGFHIFMRALPAILQARPRAEILIVGGDEVSYGKQLPAEETYRKQMLQEVGGSLDMNRVHFLGRLPHTDYIKVLQVSAVHVYLTYPFVLSWSLLEAMSTGCCIVASNTAPVAEVIKDGENGLLTDFFDHKALADKVCGVLSDPERAIPLRQAARDHAVAEYDLLRTALPAYRKAICNGAR